MRLDSGQIEVIDDEMAHVLRAKTGAERLRIVDGLFRMAREMAEASVREGHPDWDDRRVREETARRISRGAF